MAKLRAYIDDVCLSGFWRGTPHPVRLVAYVDREVTRQQAFEQLRLDITGSSISDPIWEAGLDNGDIDRALYEALDMRQDSRNWDEPHPLWQDVMPYDNDMHTADDVCAFVVVEIIDD